MNDISRLAEALTDTTIGMFQPNDVTTLAERSAHEIAEALDVFFEGSSRDDILLVYYSGHGLTNDRGDELLLCGRNSRTDRRRSTTVSSLQINAMIEASSAQSVVIILDCCHSGAFKGGEIADSLAGAGRYILSSCRPGEKAVDANHDSALSQFTMHLVDGLRDGAKPRSDIWVSLSDLYWYVHAAMTSSGRLIPQRRFHGSGEIPIARRPNTRTGSTRGPGGTLYVSETSITLEVEAAEHLPTEFIYVTASSGREEGWTAETKADWVYLTKRASHVEIDLRPRAEINRANIVVRDLASGEARTIRIVVRQRSAPMTQSHLTPGRIAFEDPIFPSPPFGVFSSQVFDILAAQHNDMTSRFSLNGCRDYNEVVRRMVPQMVSWYAKRKILVDAVGEVTGLADLDDIWTVLGNPKRSPSDLWKVAASDRNTSDVQAREVTATGNAASSLPGKVRVVNLAKELGVPSKNVLAMLKSLGVFVKSASSTMEVPVARRAAREFATIDVFARIIADDALERYDERERQLGFDSVRALEGALVLKVSQQGWTEYLQDCRDEYEAHRADSPDWSVGYRLGANYDAKVVSMQQLILRGVFKASPDEIRELINVAGSNLPTNG